MAVPPFRVFYASMSDMNREQRDFFDTWSEAWKRGKALDVEGQVSYLFCFAYPLLKMPPQKASGELLRLADAYSHEPLVVRLCKEWASDCFVLMKNYLRAVEVYPTLEVSSQSTYPTEKLMSLKLVAGVRLTGRDVLTLCGPKVTQFGRANLDRVAEYTDVIVRAHEQSEGVNLLTEWVRNTDRTKYGVFNASQYGYDASQEVKIPYYLFSQNVTVLEFIKQTTRDAENTVRNEAGIPAVGEGWVSETALYYELTKAFVGYDVIHHFSPGWLGRQHLDIFIRELNVAIEFQGLQHDQPVAYFGGEKSYVETRRRDEKKRRLCTRNGVRLLYVRPGYILKDVIEEIRNQLQK